MNYISSICKGNPDWEPFEKLLNRYCNPRKENEIQDPPTLFKEFSSEAKQVLEENFGGSFLSQLSMKESKMNKHNLPSNRNTRIDNRPTAANETASVSASVSNSKCPKELALNVMKEKIKERIMNDQTKNLVSSFNMTIVEHFNLGELEGDEKKTVVQRICHIVKCFMKVMQKNIYSNTPFPVYISKSKHRLDLKNIVGGFMYEIMFEQGNLSTKTLIIDYLKGECAPRVKALQQAIVQKNNFALNENKRIVKQFPEFLLENKNLPYQEAVKMIQNLKQFNDPSVKADEIKLIIDNILHTANEHFKHNEEACSSLAQGWREPEIRASVIAFCILESQNTDLFFDFEIMEMFIEETDQIKAFKASINLLIEPYKGVGDSK